MDPDDEVKNKRYLEIEALYGEDFADAIAIAREIYDGDDGPAKREAFFLAVQFSMPGEED